MQTNTKWMIMFITERDASRGSLSCFYYCTLSIFHKVNITSHSDCGGHLLNDFPVRFKVGGWVPHYMVMVIQNQHQSCWTSARYGKGIYSKFWQHIYACLCNLCCLANCCVLYHDHEETILFQHIQATQNNDNKNPSDHLNFLTLQ